ncbi:MAG: DUF1385 domain-containing protein [Clostridia bacterium]|nr:DUF1385 domain-containing protein [Clostridia bacterium]
MSKNKQDAACPIRKSSVGGQALIEGVMMNGPKGAAMSVRLADGTIKTELKHMNRLKNKYAIARVPVLRGVISFVESMIFGYKCLMESAELASAGEMESAEAESKLDRWLEKHLTPKVFHAITLVASVLGVAVAAALFLWLPSFLVDLVNTKLADGVLSPYKPALEGVIRIIIVVAYMFIVSRMKDIHRVFMYHGAEHKSIFCYESGLELTVENVRKMSRFHPRCGTSFIFVVLIISILTSSIIILIFPTLADPGLRLLWVLIKLLLIPVVMGVGYEFITYAGKHENVFVKILSAPGLAMQRITTAEPTDDIIEVGIAALQGCITDNPDDDTIK